MRVIDPSSVSQQIPALGYQQQHQPPAQPQQPRPPTTAGLGPAGQVPRVPVNQTSLSVQQLQEMAHRQQQQIEQQQHMLVAKEQRLKYLRQQDLSQHHQLAAEYEHLRRLREKVEAQEMKLRKLRALRGGGQQAAQQVQPPANKNAVLADLESIRALFNEKEKELTMAVRRVEDLTHQLEDIRNGRINGGIYPPQVVELERLRRELAYRKQLSEQQNQMIAQQRAQLAMGREEITRIDSRVLELQDRLERKRMMNQQLANQISAATSAKQEQLHAMMAAGSRNKNKPVSTVEPIQRQVHSGIQEDLHNSINKNQHFSQDEKDTTKYQTLPFGSRYSNNGPAMVTKKTELTNGRYAEAPVNYPRPYNMDHQGNFTSGNGPSGMDNNNLKSSMNKPVSSVAPVMSQTTLTDSHQGGGGKAKPALPPKPMTADRNGSVSPPPYIPAPPPGSDDISPADASITIKQFNGNDNNNSTMVHPSEEGTSVDDDMPSEDDDEHNGGHGGHGGGLTVMPNVHISINRRIEMPPAFHFPENQPPPSDLLAAHKDMMLSDVTDNVASSMYPAMIQHIYNEYDHLSPEEKNRMSAAASEAIDDEMLDEDDETGNRVPEFESDPDLSRPDKPVGIIKRPKPEGDKVGPRRGVSFDPLALLLDASLEGELELVKRTAREVTDPSAANDEGITALHNAICAGHFEIVKFLVEFGCDVNAPDSDGWTPLHCAASCNNLPMVRFLVEHGACVFATTLSDHETAAEKCEEDEEGFDGCSEYLYGIQEKMGLIHGGDVYAVYNYERCREDELTFKNGDRINVIRKSDETEVEWWWSKLKSGETELEGYIPRNLLGLFPRVAHMRPVQPAQSHQPHQQLQSIQEEAKESESSASSSREEDDAAMNSN